MSKAHATPLKNATFRVPKSVWQRAKKRAIDEERSLNQVIVEALEAFAGRRTRPGSRLLADAIRFVEQRGPNRPARHFTSDQLHDRDDA